MWQLTDEDGLPSNTIYNMIQDDKGYVWMGTSYGLCRYDGMNFIPYTIPHYNDNEILHLRRDSLGRFWTINLSGQIACISDNIVSQIIPFQEKQVIDLRFENSVMWVIFRDGQKAESEKVYGIGYLEFDATGNPKTEFIYNDRYYKLSLASPKTDIDQLKLIGYQHRKKESSFVTSLSTKIDSINRSFRIPYFPPRKIYITNGKLQFINYNYTKLIEVNEVGQAKVLLDVSSMSEFNGFTNFENDFLILTQSGLYYKAQDEPIAHWMKNLTVNEIMQDSEGNYWVSTDGRGLFIIPSLDIKHYATRSKELPNDNVYSLCYDKDNKHLHVGLDNGKVITIKESKVIKQTDLPVNGRILSIIKFKGVFFYFTDSGLIRVNKNGKVDKISLLAGKTALLINDKELRIGTGTGLNSFDLNQALSDNIKLDKFKKVDIKNKRIYALHEDKKGTIWIGSTKGLLTLKDGVFQAFTDKKKTIDFSFSSIVETDDETLWCGTSGKGLINIKSDTIIQSIDRSTGLSSNTIKNLLISEGQLWAGTNKGINIIDLKTMKIRYLDKHDGLPSDEITTIEIIDTTVWVGTSKGLISFSKNLKKHNPIPPPVHITHLNIDEKTTKITDSISLDYNKNSIQIDYIGFAYSMQGELKYKYKMGNVDQDWVYTSNTAVRYTDLQPGEYTFDVIGINEDKVESLVPAKIHFSIAQPYWDTLWFKSFFALCATTVFSFIYISSSRQKEQKIKAAQEFQNTVNELRMQALQTQVNPHFIFNALNAIQQFQVSNEREQAIDYLTQFAHLIRMIFEHSKEKVITLNQEVEFLNLYLEMEKLRFKDKVNIKLKVSPELKASQQLVNVPPLLIQPIVENAFKHGLFHKGHGGELLVDFQKKDKFLICTIQDNGVGRVEAEKRNINRNKNYESSGLSTSEKRLQIYNRSVNDTKNSKNTYIKIVDLFDQQGQASGTRLELTIRI